MSNGCQVWPRRRPWEQLQAFDGVGDADQARRQSWTGSRGLSARQQVWQPPLHKVYILYTMNFWDSWGGWVVNKFDRIRGLYFPPQFVWYWGGSKGVAITQHKSNAIRSASQVVLRFSFSAMTSILWTLLPYSAEWVSPMWWTFRPCHKPMRS